MAERKWKESFLIFAASALFFSLNQPASAVPGDLDPSFGNGGKVVTDIGGLANFCNAMVVQPDGKIVLGGGTGGDFALVRYNPNGSVDGSFGNFGVVITDINGASESVYGLAIQSDGKIVVLGENNTASGNSFVLARYNTNGTLDAGFGSGGKISTTIGIGTHFGKSLAVQPDGKIVAVGSARNNLNQFAYAIARYDTNGSLDPGFATGGKLLVSVGTSDQAQSVEVQSNGKIVVAGVSNSNFGLARLNPDGSPDSGFGNVGTVSTDIEANDLARDVLIQSDGKIVAVGRSNGFAAFALVRYNSNGTLDETFGNAGKVTTVVGTSSREAVAGAIQPDGKIIAGGSSGPSSAGDFTLVRYNPNGSVDSSFGQNGFVITSIGQNTPDFASGMALAGDGKIILAGYYSPETNSFDFAVVRYLNGPFAQAARPPFDFDGDGKTDISIYRPSLGQWWLNRSTDGVIAHTFGNSSDRIVPGDFTGDGKTDVAIYRPSAGEWFVLRSEDYTFYSFPFGNSTDTPVPADYDGDGKTDPAVFRSSNSTWYIQRSSDNGTTIEGFGSAGDVPVPADYDGDGKADIAIYRPSLGQWWLKRSTAGVIAVTFGNSTDKPVPGDYTGDGKSDIAIWRPASGEWFILRSEDYSFYSFPFGSTGDTPVPGDYDGDGKTDAGVFRPSTATWYLNRSTAGVLIQGFGLGSDQPVPAAFVP